MGTLMAFGGVLVRSLPNPLPVDNLVITLSGYMVSILGLFTITLGTRRRENDAE